MKKYKNVYVEIINRCNLDCSFCPKTDRKAKAMSLAEFDIVLSKVAPCAEYIYLHVVGEPLLHPEFDNLLKCADKHNAKIKLTTNGTLLKDNLNILTAHESLKAVNISLSCLKDFDDAAANVYLDKVFSAAKELSQNKIAVILRAWTNINANLIKEKLLAAFGATVSFTDNGFQKITDYLLFNTESEFVWPVRTSLPEQQPDMQQQNAQQLNTQQPNKCLGLRKQFAVLCDGTVVPCCLDNNGILDLGNIFENNLNEILLSKKALQIAQGFANSRAVEPFCQTCTFSKY